MSLVKEFAAQWFQGDFDFENTGHFWYPPGAYMSVPCRYRIILPEL